MMKIVIIAGGKGTRIASVNNEIPKAMIPVDGKPVLERQIEMAIRQGYHDFILLIGYLGEKIQNYFGNGEKWNANITYYRETKPLGTAGALAEISNMLTENFFVFYGDTVMDIDLQSMATFHKNKKSDMTLFVHPNDHPYDSDIVITDINHKVIKIENKPHSEHFISHNIINAAVFIFSPNVIKYIPKGIKTHIEKNIIPTCIKNGLNVYAYLSHEYVKDMGTPERYEHVCNDWLSGRVLMMNKQKPQKAIFLDRDGVINKDNGLIFSPSQLELIDGVADGLNLIHTQGYLAIIVTNQSVIARNLCSFEELDTINATLESLLGKKHTYYDALYFCPHHPDAGFPEERKEYKIKCKCRKPAPGLLLKAAQDLNIDLSESYMIGDRDSDVQAGENAKVKQSIKIETNRAYALYHALKEIFKKNDNNKNTF